MTLSGDDPTTQFIVRSTPAEDGERYIQSTDLLGMQIEKGIILARNCTWRLPDHRAGASEHGIPKRPFVSEIGASARRALEELPGLAGADVPSILLRPADAVFAQLGPQVRREKHSAQG